MLQNAPMYSYIPAKDVAPGACILSRVISTAGDAQAAWFKDTEGDIMALTQTL
jgi:hypothetical protein